MADNCFERCLKCLARVPGATLSAWISMVVSVCACAAAVMIGAQRTRDLLSEETILPHMDIVCLSVILGMLVFGFLFLMVSVMSTGRTSKKLFNSSSKNICARVLNITMIVLMFLLLVVWILVTTVLAIPVLYFILLYILHRERNMSCIDLENYALSNSSRQFCDHGLDRFYNEGQDAFLCYIIAFVAAFLVVISMVFFITFASVNFICLTDGRSSSYKSSDPRSSGNSVDTRM